MIKALCLVMVVLFEIIIKALITSLLLCSRV